MKLLSCVRLLATPWTAAHQAPPSMGFSRQEYWSGVPLPSPFMNSLLSYKISIKNGENKLSFLNGWLNYISIIFLHFIAYSIHRHLVFPIIRQWHPTPVLLPGESHGRRSLVGCSPWGRWELDETERLHFHFSLSCIGEGNGSPLQCSCLENPRDRGAW